MSPKRGARTASDAVWLKMVPMAMAEGLTGGRSVKVMLVFETCVASLWFGFGCSE